MATKTDIAALEQKMETRIAEMKAAIGVLEARLTWRFVVAIVFLNAVMTVLDLFVD